MGREPAYCFVQQSWEQNGKMSSNKHTSADSVLFVQLCVVKEAKSPYKQLINQQPEKQGYAGLAGQPHKAQSWPALVWFGFQQI